MAKYFHLTISTDTFLKKKPSPQGELFSARKFGCKLQDILLVGDSVVDMQTTRNAGFSSIGVEYGYADGANLIEEGTLATIAYFKTIPFILKDIF
ncbi:uncharacterized protein METZ01_LOCUS490590 [marine metagenome]|uniref:Phosphoglycolate phosphatase n=1 Tax=marine metagenome TaxID=408172 RepID=A0A383CZJ8_9ZZZZ